MRNDPAIAAATEVRPGRYPDLSGLDLHRAWPGSQALFTRGLGHRDVLADPSVIDAIAGYVAARPG